MRKIGPRFNECSHSEQLVHFTNIIYFEVCLPQQSFAQFWQNDMNLFLHETAWHFLRFRACGVEALVLLIAAALIRAIDFPLSLLLRSSLVNSRRNCLLDNSLVVGARVVQNLENF